MKQAIHHNKYDPYGSALPKIIVPADCNYTPHIPYCNYFPDLLLTITLGFTWGGFSIIFNLFFVLYAVASTPGSNFSSLGFHFDVTLWHYVGIHCSPMFFLYLSPRKETAFGGFSFNGMHG